MTETETIIDHFQSALYDACTTLRTQNRPTSGMLDVTVDAGDRHSRLLYGELRDRLADLVQGSGFRTTLLALHAWQWWRIDHEVPPTLDEIVEIVLGRLEYGQEPDTRELAMASWTLWDLTHQGQALSLADLGEAVSRVIAQERRDHPEQFADQITPE